MPFATSTPCDCCGTPPIGCDCCPEGPDQPVPEHLTITLDADLSWDSPIPGLCPDLLIPGSTPIDMTLTPGLGCSWSYALPVDCPNAVLTIYCDGGVWYLWFRIFYITLHEARWVLPDFSCCDTSQDIALDLVAADPIFTSLPTDILIESVGCLACDCGCCTDGFWSEYTLTVAGITTTGCSDCTRLNGSWTLTKVAGCGWETATPVPGFCTGAGPYWSLACSGGTWFLSSHVDAPLYTTTDDLCVDGGTLDLTAGPFLCTDYPATLTITPGGTFIPCP